MGKFAVKTTNSGVRFNLKAGEFRFRLKASNGQTIVSSEGYTTLAKCMNGIASVKKNAPEAEVVMEK